MEFHCAVSKRIAHRKQRIQLVNSIHFGWQQSVLPRLLQKTA
jgi:hypothetical protein